jgi:hypothetical protein
MVGCAACLRFIDTSLRRRVSSSRRFLSLDFYIPILVSSSR